MTFVAINRIIYRLTYNLCERVLSFETNSSISEMMVILFNLPIGFLTFHTHLMINILLINNKQI
jgi:hypothetical protein